MKILVIKQTSLGDVLHATVPIRLLKEQYPDSHLTLLTDKSSYPVVENNPYIDVCLLIDIHWCIEHFWKHPVRVLRTFWRTLIEVRRTVYDFVIDLQGLERRFFLCMGREQG